ncbi:hypothetical protein CE91St43_06220 [Oscillospiraceae bacterium]|nr:hypothetical protein CE91St43_06220 [Oscillospiraceae bacterium]
MVVLLEPSRRITSAIGDVDVEAGEDHVGENQHGPLDLEGDHVKYKVDAQVLAVGDGGGDAQIDHPDEHDGGELLHPGEGVLENVPADHLEHQHHGQDKEADGADVQLDVVEKGFEVKFAIFHGEKPP